MNHMTAAIATAVNFAMDTNAGRGKAARFVRESISKDRDMTRAQQRKDKRQEREFRAC